MRKLAALIIGTVLLLSAAGFYYSNSFIQINVTGANSGKTSISLINQKTRKQKIITTDAASAKVRMPKASYELLVSNKDNSYLRVVKTTGFLKTLQVEAKLSAEKSRQFVGNNPADCVGYGAGILATYTCGDFYGTINIHNPPPDNSTPTYITKPVGSGITGFLRGFATTSEGLLALIQHPAGEDVEQYYSVNSIGSDFNSKSETALAELTPSATYNIKPYLQGFLIYDNTLGSVLYYPAASAKPEAIKNAKPSQNAVVPVGLSVAGDIITTLYSTSEDTADKDARSEFVITSAGTSKDYTLKKYYSDATVCAAGRLCALNDKSKVLDVYDISGKTPKFQYSLIDVTNMQTTPAGFTFTNNDGIANFDVITSSGSMEFSFGSYIFHSISWVAGGYVLNLDSSSTKRLALFVSQASANTDSIDKKLLALQKIPQVASISAYKNSVFISPEAGELVYVPALRSYGYDPAKLASSAAAINSEIDKLGINRQAYTIINTLQQ